jgi:tight adherence protein C
LSLAGVCLAAGGVSIAAEAFRPRRARVARRLAAVRGDGRSEARRLSLSLLETLPRRLLARVDRGLERAGGSTSRRRYVEEKVALALGVPFVFVVPMIAASGGAPSPLVVAVLAIGGFFVPDLALAHAARRRREAVFVDLPDVIAVLALALGAGQSLRRALELAARDGGGPLATEIERALTLARRRQGVSEREALVHVARELGEPRFARFAELLAAKESPYVEFLRQQAAQARSEQARYLERAGDRAYLAMHAPVALLLAVLVFLLAYGFLHVLTHPA